MVPYDDVRQELLVPARRHPLRRLLVLRARKVPHAVARRLLPRDRAAADEGAVLGRSWDSAEEEDPGTTKHDGRTSGAIIGRNDDGGGGASGSWQSGGGAAWDTNVGMMELGWANW
jgi:uncharacterized membrane protein YgcG